MRCPRRHRPAPTSQSRGNGEASSRTGAWPGKSRRWAALSSRPQVEVSPHGRVKRRIRPCPSHCRSGEAGHQPATRPLRGARKPSPMTSQLITALPPVVAEHIAAVNAFDNERIVATFAPGAYVNDDRREIWGIAAIRTFTAKEIVGDHGTMDVREVIDHHADNIVRAKYGCYYDKTNLP